jgi:hypothetical protein
MLFGLPIVKNSIMKVSTVFYIIWYLTMVTITICVFQPDNFFDIYNNRIIWQNIDVKCFLWSIFGGMIYFALPFIITIYPYRRKK